MPKYKEVNEIVIEGFIEKLFSKVGQAKSSKVLDKLSDQDPDIKKDLEVLQKLRDKMNKELNTKAKRNAELQRIMKQYG
tara:strand:+ start:53 stop:289 length:237 start_codon:yes stop_codon:yes gene_type:complete